MPIKTGPITIDARTTRRSYGRYYPNVADWVAHYEHRVALHLGTIRSTKTGAALLSAIAKPVTIRPLTEPKEVNAFASPSSCRDATQLIEDLIGCTAETPWDLGTGSGSESTVRFTPGTWTAGDPLKNRKYGPDAPGARPDEILCHELVHAMRHTQGEWDRSYMKDGFDRKDEFHAIMICNIYCSERKRPLRRSHHGHAAMQRDFASDGFRFFAWYNREVRKFVSDLPELSRQLNRIDCPWNPIREHFAYEQTLREIEVDRRTPRPGYW